MITRPFLILASNLIQHVRPYGHCGGDRSVDQILVSARQNTAVLKTFNNFYLLLCSVLTVNCMNKSN
jgi:hypothetical protein